MNHIFLFSLMIVFFNIHFSTNAQIEQSIDAVKVIETLPMFPGCEKQPDSIQSMRCTERALLEYCSKYIKYPDIIQGVALEGIVVVQFLVTKEGRIEQAKIARSLGKPYDDEALRVINSMNNMEERWLPGTRNGQAVDMSYSFPIRFRAPRNKKNVTPPRQVSEADASEKQNKKKSWNKRNQKRKSND